MKWRILCLALPVLFLPSITFFLAPALASGGLAFWALDIAIRVVIPVLCLIALYQIDVRPRDYGLASPLTSGRQLAFLGNCLLAICAYFSSILVYNFARSIIGDQIEGGFPSEFGVVGTTYFLVVPALVEEVFFRGVLAVALLASFNTASGLMYVVFSAAVFAMVHWAPDLSSTVSFFYIGIVSSTMYFFMRNLWPLILAHISLNTLLTVW